MKNRSLIAAIACALMLLQPSFAQTPFETPWSANKYSMFIHFGLYSTLGGVYDGQEIHRGYSEQIQSHAGIYGDEYSALARTFDPEKFNADSIVALAQRAGMRSIVITSKHHDGFCLFRTKTTDYNSWDAPAKSRDFIAELSQACARAGMNFGLYYSLIDWHAPCADHITSHNATFITPEHHELNKAQVEELVSNYGRISELWFDMGSLTPQQSKDLYDIVKGHQPDCMVGGRLGNGFYDFAVMGDNFYPEESLQTAWQSPASMFNETWGYRSWQKRGDPHEKAKEKLLSLIRVVSNGGNYLLNIGPEGDGSVVPFEAEVLEEIGSWLSRHGDAIYSTSASPFRTQFDWGYITRKGSKMNLILTGEKPSEGVISIPFGGYRLLNVEGPATASLAGGRLVIKPSADAFQDDFQVVTLTFDKDIQPEEATVVNKRLANTSYFCQDYYTNGRSEVSYLWNFKPAGKVHGIGITYTSDEIGTVMDATVNGNRAEIVLDGASSRKLDVKPVEVAGTSVLCDDMSSFGSDMSRLLKKDGWEATAADSGSFKTWPFYGVLVKKTVVSPCDQEVILDVAAGNGIELQVNGVTVMKHLNPYRCTYRQEKVRVSLKAGENTIALWAYNRFEKKVTWMLRLSDDQTLYTTEFSVPQMASWKKSGVYPVTIRRADAATVHEDCQLHNVILNIK